MLLLSLLSSFGLCGLENQWLQRYRTLAALLRTGPPPTFTAWDCAAIGMDWSPGLSSCFLQRKSPQTFQVHPGQNTGDMVRLEGPMLKHGSSVLFHVGGHEHGRFKPSYVQLILIADSNLMADMYN